MEVSSKKEMILEEQNILFFSRTMGQGGTENVILQLCEILKPRANKIIVCSCGGIAVQKLEEMRIQHYEIPDISEKRFSKMLKIYKKLIRIIKDEQITVIHAHHRMAALYSGIAAGTGIIQVINVHNTFHDKKLLTRLAYRGKNIIAVGEMVKKNLINAYHLPDKQVEVIHNAVKPYDGGGVLLPELAKEREEGNILIGNIGRLSKQKGMEYFIEAAGLLYEKYPRAKFYIVGDGEDRKKLERMAGKLLLDGVLTFLGYRSDIQNVMMHMDFIVLSSLWEGLPLTLIEAYSVGKTVIATAVDGTPEIVTDGISGLLVEAKDAVSLAEKMKWMIENPDRRRKMEENSVRKYREDFSFGKMQDSYVRYYERL